jgi:TRAP-type mannitol/chloroaromatic compound transport system substrate-binding protein
MKKIKRKDFIKKSLITVAGSSLMLGSCAGDETSSITSPNIITSKKYKWKLVTTWPPNFPVLGEGCNMLAEWVKTMSGGRMEINVYGGGELVPALESFEAVSSGAVEMGHGAAYYWAGKSPAMQFFTTVPFGMNAQQMNSWVYCGGGLELWEELYAKFGLVPFPAGNTGVQMAGWFNREINSIEDFKGLKMRIPGLGGKVLEKAGGTAVLSAGSEIYTNLERGVIDATEWIGPYHDYKMGFHNIAKYYYAPGWHEPGPILDLFINKRAFDGLALDLQEIIRTAAYRLNAWATSEFEAKNNFYLKKMIEEDNVDVRNFSKDVLNDLKKYSLEVIEEVTSKDQDSAKVYASCSKFQKEIRNWSNYSEKLYHNSI